MDYSSGQSISSCLIQPYSSVILEIVDVYAIEDVRQISLFNSMLIQMVVDNDRIDSPVKVEVLEELLGYISKLALAMSDSLTR